MEYFGDENMCETVESVLSLMDLHLFPNTGSVAHEKLPSDEIERPVIMGTSTNCNWLKYISPDGQFL